MIERVGVNEHLPFLYMVHLLCAGDDTLRNPAFRVKMVVNAKNKRRG